MLRRIYWTVKRLIPGPKTIITMLLKGGMKAMGKKNRAGDGRDDFEQRP